MRTIGPSLLVLGMLALLGVAAGPALAEQKDNKGDGKKQKGKRNFTIGKETTHVSGPLDEDGTIDYATALNRRLGKGVKPADNAVVLLWKAFGPRPEGGRGMPPDFFKWLGMAEPPARGDYFVDLGRFMKERPDPALHDQLGRCGKRPWTAKEYPAIAAWLEANEKPLALVVEASKRPHYFSPLVPGRTGKGRDGLIGVLLPGVQKCRALASALLARALLRVGQGRTADAWQDLLACHRLARLVGRGGTLIELLVGIALDALASKAELAFLDGSKLKAKQTIACLRDLHRLPPMPAVADKVDLGERFMFLDCVMLIQRGGIETLAALADGTRAKRVDPEAQQALDSINWGPALRTGNRWYDRMAAALRVKDRTERERKLEQIEQDLKKLHNQVGGAGGLVKALAAKDTAEGLGQAIGDVLVTMLVPAVGKVQQAGDRAAQIQANLHLAFALAAYHSDHGRYPQKLDELEPKYVKTIARDIFSGKPLTYRPSGKGYLLYSVGVNGRDDGGRGYDDKPPGDDLNVRMPLPGLPPLPARPAAPPQ
jgi:hypothetical protein